MVVKNRSKWIFMDSYIGEFKKNKIPAINMYSLALATGIIR